jgi:GTP-binding protein
VEYRESDPLKIKSVEFVGAIGQIGQAPPETVVGFPQVAVAGRSNVGKSSLINRLLGRTRTQLARVSQQPGKTQEINFYRVRTDLGEFFLVDLPGYGYAKAPEELRGRWRPLIHGYLSSPDLRGVLQLIDIRSGPTADDIQSVEYLSELGIPAFFALTKSDQVKAARRAEMVKKTTRALGVDADQVLPFSSLKGDGREGLLAVLRDLLFTEEEVDADAPAEDEAESPGK